jgi:hypothetical protein
MFQCFRAVADEQRIANLIELLAADGPSEDEIRRQFPALMASAANRLAVRTSLFCREVALRVLRTFGGGLPDYIAVRLIVAIQSLAFPHLQSAIARATISGLSDLITEIR